MGKKVKLIGLHGAKRSGKDTLAQYIQQKYEWGRISFAQPLYAGLAAMFPWIPAGCWTDRNIEVPRLGKTVNELLQSLGTGWGREQVHTNVWVDEAIGKAVIASALDNVGVVISDVRFTNEAEGVRKIGGVIVAIDSVRGVVINGHVSEKILDCALVDYRVQNNGIPEDMFVQFDALGLI